MFLQMPVVLGMKSIQHLTAASICRTAGCLYPAAGSLLKFIDSLPGITGIFLMAAEIFPVERPVNLCRIKKLDIRNRADPYYSSTRRDRLHSGQQAEKTVLPAQLLQPGQKRHSGRWKAGMSFMMRA